MSTPDRKRLERHLGDQVIDTGNNNILDSVYAPAAVVSIEDRAIVDGASA